MVKTESRVRSSESSEVNASELRTLDSELYLHTSVIMVSYYTGPILWFSLESVLAQDGLKELIIVNNGNPSGVVKRLQKLAHDDARCTLITGNGNIGFAKACNKAVAQATGKYLLLLNPDCLLKPYTLTRTIEALQKRPEAWLAGGRLIGPDGHEQAGGRRNLLTPWKALVEGLKLYRLAPNHPYFTRINLHEQQPMKKTDVVPAISGAFMAISNEHYQQLGGMDEEYFLHVEDLDFCYRIHEAGGNIIYMPQVEVIHYLSTSKAPTTQVEWHKTKGFLRYLNKHFKKTYPAFFLWLVKVGAIARFILRFISTTPEYIINLVRHKRSTPSIQRRTLLLSTSNNTPKDESIAASATMKTVLITGATGQVGTCVMRQMLKHNKHIIALRHKQKIPFEGANTTWIKAELESTKQNALPLTAETQLDAIVHTAGIWLLPPHLDRLAEAGLKRVICFSSTSIFGKAESQNPKERELVERFKWGEEEIARRCDALGIHWTVFRPTLIYGVGLDKNICAIARFIERFGFFPVMAPGTGRRQPVHADDLARAALMALENPNTYSKLYNLSGGEVLEYREMVGRVFKLLDKPERIIAIRMLPRIMDIVSKLTGRVEFNGEIARRMNQHLIFSHDEATQDFGYRPRNFFDPNWPELSGSSYL